MRADAVLLFMTKLNPILFLMAFLASSFFLCGRAVSAAEAAASAVSTPSAPSGKTVTLLISLDPKDYPGGLAGLIHNYKKSPEKLAATFKSEFENSGFEIQVIQNANRYDLYQALHSPDNVGVFWLSHETPVVGKPNSIVDISAPLLDHNLADVKPLFEEINPNIRWVSIVACDSDLVINWLKKQPFRVESASIQGFDEEIDATQGLKKAISLARSTLEEAKTDPVIKECPTLSGYPIQLHRDLRGDPNKESFFPAVSVTIGHEIIAAFPEAHLTVGEIQAQEETGYIPGTLSPTSDPLGLEIIADSGFSVTNLPAGFQMGLFSVTAPWAGAHWSAFLYHGAPTGITDQILDFDGTIPDNLVPQAISVSSCALPGT